MALVDQFRQQNPNQLSELMQQAQALAAQNGGAQALIDQLADNGAVCTMPSGKQISVKEIVSMSKTMTPQQLLLQLMQA